MKKMQTHFDLANGELHTAVLLQRALKRRLKFHAHGDWCAEISSGSELSKLIGGALLYDSRYRPREVQVLALGASVVLIDVNRPHDSTPTVDIDVWSVSRQSADDEVDRLEAVVRGAAVGAPE